MSTTQHKQLIAAAGLLAAAPLTASAAFSGYTPVTVTPEATRLSVSASDYFGTEPITSDRGAFPTEITWQIAVFNQQGFDIGSVAFRIDGFDDETYAPGVFEQIVFVDPGDPPAGFVGPATLSVADTMFEGDIDAPFTVDSFQLSDDTGNLSANQRLDVTFEVSEPHAVGDELVYEFTVFNPNASLYEVGIEFFPVPTPGAAALAGFAALGMTRRRRA